MKYASHDQVVSPERGGDDSDQVHGVLSPANGVSAPRYSNCLPCSILPTAGDGGRRGILGIGGAMPKAQPAQ